MQLDLTGQKFGILTAIKITGKTKQGRNIWFCKCDCGHDTHVQSSKLKNGHTQSCGCKKYTAIRKYGKSLFIDLKGQRFGRLTVLEQADHEKGEKTKWRCSCDCGKQTVVVGERMKTGNTKSCGCLNKETTTRTHGHTTGGKFTPEYRSWSAMLTRCNNKNGKSFERYGGRGIKVCERWSLSFECFLSDMGYKPEGKYSIERKDTNGDYAPDNCYWATDSEQMRNRRRFKNNKSGTTGVYYDETKHKWISAIGVNGMQVHLGTHDDEIKAKDAREEAEKIHWNPPT